MAINRTPGNTGPNNINPLGGPNKADSAKPTSGAQFNAPASAAGNTPASQPSKPAGGANLDAIKSRVQDALDQGKSKPEILDLLVEEHLEQTLGDNATAEVKTKVAQQFRADPQLTQLFNAVYNAATK